MTDDRVTIQEAADILNVSREYVQGLLGNGTLTSAYMRIKRADVIALKGKHQQEAAKALDEMAQISQELGLD